MLRMYVAQLCFGPADEGIEDAIYDRQAIPAFVGIDLNRKNAPDATNLRKFRHLLEVNGVTQKIFEAINAHLAAERLMMREEKEVVLRMSVMCCEPGVSKSRATRARNLNF